MLHYFNFQEVKQIQSSVDILHEDSANAAEETKIDSSSEMVSIFMRRRLNTSQYIRIIKVFELL